MKQSGHYTLQELRGWLQATPWRRRLVRDGIALRVVVQGDAIDLQAQMGACTLFATSYDYFDGCNHWLHLLRQDGTLIDQLRMPDQFGFIENVSRLSEHELTFGYFGTNDIWHLSVNEQGVRSFSPRALLTRPNRFLFGARHLQLSRTKGPPWNPGVQDSSAHGS